ncbi:MAG: family aminopeptidase [Firmicutes bacterium]|nr:family aminopeptidase [Bacillota bacterium]
MDNKLKAANELIDFIYESPNSYHAVSSIKKILLENGFSELQDDDRWQIERGGRYFAVKNGSAITAFVAGLGDVSEKGFRMIGAHTDSPGFRIKPSPEINAEGAYVKLNTEVYGGPILNTWMDRPLAAAGRVTVESGDVMKPEVMLVNFRKPILVIPNLAIHMNRNINTGIELNRQKDVLPLMATISENLESGSCFIKALAEELDVPEKKILDFDLFLYEYEKGCVTGIRDEFISSGRLDDLLMVHAGVMALVESGESDSTKVLVCFDNEEVGNTTKQGADSALLATVLERITLSMGIGREDYFRALSRSFMISCDLGHALHPNYAEKCDPVNKPVINRGPIIKISANQSYTTDAVSGAVFEGICRKAGIPVQKFVNRSDERGGSTIGPVTASLLNIKTVDVGTAVLAMHSIRELAGIDDYLHTIKAFAEYYKI